MEEETGMFFFPREMLIQIFHKLPIKSVIRFKIVCKEWLCLISDPFFRSNYIKTYQAPATLMVIPNDTRHLHPWTATYSAYEIHGTGLQPVCQPQPCPLPNCDPNRVQVVGSYNGLVALYQNTLEDYPSSLIDEWVGYTFFFCEIGQFCLFNPCTKENKRVRVPDFEETFSKNVNYMCNTWSFGVTGLCHDSESDEYKVVVAQLGDLDRFAVVTFRDDNDNNCCRFHPKSIIPKVYATPRSSLVGCRLGTTVQGYPHWLYLNTILYFDWRAEEFRTAQLPKDVETNVYCGQTKAALVRGLGALDGQLTVALATTIHEFEVWALKEYGNDDSWSRLFVMPRLHDFPMCCFSLLSWNKDDWVAFMFDDICYGPYAKQVIIHDLRNQSFRLLHLNLSKPRMLQLPEKMATYFPTLVSPNHH